MAIHTPYLAGAEKPKINALIYGRPGCGKTTFAAQANDHPDMANALFLNVEGGLLSVAHRGDIQAIDIRDSKTLEDVFWDLVNKDPAFADIQTIVIDSGSELQSVGLQQIVSDAVADPKKVRRDDLDEIEIGDYGKSTAQLTRLFRWFRDSPYHVIITALPKYVFPKGNTNENKEPIDCIPSFTAKLAESVMGYVDFVWYMYIDAEGNRKMLTQEKGIYRAKTRGPEFAMTLGQVVSDPNLSSIYDLLLKTQGKTPSKPVAIKRPVTAVKPPATLPEPALSPESEQASA